MNRRNIKLRRHVDNKLWTLIQWCAQKREYDRKSRDMFCIKKFPSVILPKGALKTYIHNVDDILRYAFWNPAFQKEPSGPIQYRDPVLAI